jgi:hypothetical protein
LFDVCFSFHLVDKQIIQAQEKKNKLHQKTKNKKTNLTRTRTTFNQGEVFFLLKTVPIKKTN